MNPLACADTDQGQSRPHQWAWISVAAALLLQATELPWALSLGLALAALPPARASWREPMMPVRRPWLMAGLALLLIAVAAAFPGHWLSREAGIALGTGLLVLKAAESRMPRDLLVTAGFACFIIITALLAGQGLGRTALAAIGLIAPLCCLQSLQGGTPPMHRLWRDALPVTGWLLLALPLTATAFLAIPRLASPLWGTPDSGSERTGLADHLSAADFSAVMNDDRPALRITFRQAPPEPAARYFRAYVMWHFDGRDWDGGTAWKASAPHAAGDLRQSELRRYEVIMEPDGTRHLPVLDWPADPPPPTAGARLDADGILRRDTAVSRTIRYAMSAAPLPSIQNLDPAERRAGLQWPSGAAPRTLALGRQWQTMHLDDEAIVRRGMQYFRQQGFAYTLRPPAPQGDPTDSFMFDGRRGYCVHFASAFVLLMRAAGLPARVVSGYQGGYWSRIGHYLLVRHSDAHAWTEVWIAARHAWIRYDPTAMASPERISSGPLAAGALAGDDSPAPWLQRLKNHWDLVNQLWDRSVIGFDQSSQARLLAPSTHSPSWLRIDPRMGLLLIMIGIGVIAICWAQRSTSSVDPLVKTWRQLCRHLAARGLPMRGAEGPHAYLERAAQAFPSRRKEIERIRTLYVLTRYAETHPEPDRIRALRQAVRNFRREKLSEHS